MYRTLKNTLTLVIIEFYISRVVTIMPLYCRHFFVLTIYLPQSHTEDVEKKMCQDVTFFRSRSYLIKYLNSHELIYTEGTATIQLKLARGIMNKNKILLI